jgi:hypothetical protein
MVTGSRIAWPERSINLWDRALRVVSSALLELARMSSDVEMGSEKARWLREVGKGGFDSRVKDEVACNAGVECVIFGILTAGEAGATTAGTAGISDVFSFPLAAALDPSTNMLDGVISSRLDPDIVPGAKGSRP